jgi:hypothetical protein
VELSDVERKEEITRVLTATDPNLPKNLTKYNYREKAYKIDPPGPGEQLAIHFEMNGCVIDANLVFLFHCFLLVLITGLNFFFPFFSLFFC